jgi:hypothetical protein
LVLRSAVFGWDVWFQVDAVGGRHFLLIATVIRLGMAREAAKTAVAKQRN